MGCHEKSRAGDERLRRVRGPTGARRGRRPARTSRAPRRDDPRDRPLVDGSSDSVFKKPRARHISSVELRASLATLDAPAAATPFAASAPLPRACFGTSWDVRRELRGGGARALPRVSAIQPTQRKKGARLAHQLSSSADAPTWQQKQKKPRTRTREQSAKNADNKQKPSMRPVCDTPESSSSRAITDFCPSQIHARASSTRSRPR